MSGMRAARVSSDPAEYVRAAEVLLRGLKTARVLAAMSPQLPEDLVEALVEVARRKGVELTLLIADLSGQWRFVSPAALDDLAQDRLKLVVLAGGVPRRLSGLVDHLPNSLWEIDRLIAEGELGIDVFVARVGAGDGSELTFGEMIGYSATALATVERIGLEVVPDEFRFDGTGGVDRGRAEIVLHRPIPSLSPAQSVHTGSADAEAIGRQVASLIPDGATVQLGLGAAPLSVIPALVTKADLGIHSGILPAALQPLQRQGVLTGSGKGLGKGRLVATGVFGGTPEGWGPEVLLRPVSETHSLRTLLAVGRLWSINSAFEIDLAGQVNAEYVHGARLASGGGQTDFVRAAHMSRDGAAVIVLPSRSRSDRSRLVRELRPDHLATTAGCDVDYVVTEHGVARLRGLTAGERRDALIEVAHPDDRAGLRIASDHSGG